MRLKAQTATEYIIILAVVIIISLIVVGLVLSSSTAGERTPQNADIAYFSTATDVAITNTFYKSDGNVSFTIKNHLGQDISVRNVTTSINGVEYDISTTAFVLKTGRSRQVYATTTSCTQGNSVVFESVQVCYENTETTEVICQDYKERSLSLTCST